MLSFALTRRAQRSVVARPHNRVGRSDGRAAADELRKLHFPELHGYNSTARPLMMISNIQLLRAVNVINRCLLVVDMGACVAPTRKDMDG